jgi:hypothetical protein
MNEEQVESLLEVLGGLYIQSLRVYDLLCIIADKVGADAVGLKSLHEQGYTLGPDPSLRIENDSEQDRNGLDKTL